MAILPRLFPYLWPRRAPGLRLRVAACLLLLVAAKCASVAVPWLYKATVDALARPADALAAIPIGLIAAYGLTRVVQQAFTQAQDAVFARVLQRAVRALSLEVFERLCALSLGFHLDRRVGALARSIKRGTDGLDVILRRCSAPARRCWSSPSSPRSCGRRSTGGSRRSCSSPSPDTSPSPSPSPNGG
jgi:ATP-binding cassette subfamily B protein